MSLLQASEFWVWQFIGRLHPLIVHFPIGLICVALLLEILDWNKKPKQYRNGIRVLIWIGAVSSILAVVFGLMLAESEGSNGRTLQFHKWFGIATMLLCTFTLAAFIRKQFAAYRGLLITSVLGISIAGHFGAEVTHGSDYLTSTLPFGKSEKQENLNSTANVVLASLRNTETLTPQQELDLNMQVRTILAHNCFSCHNGDKTKGGLRLDRKELLMKGGESGPALIAGKPEESEMIKRVSLPDGHKDLMPAKGKRLEPQQVEVLKLWIAKGAPWPEGKGKGLFRTAELAPRLPEVPAVHGEISAPIDLFVDNYFMANKIKWGQPVDERTYIRRVYLDAIGLLPKPAEVEAFLADTRPDKREQLVKGLLNRSTDYTQNWLTFWNDILRNDYTGTGYIDGGRFDITKWLYTSLEDNKPFNVMVKELISPTDESKGFIKGIKWRGAVNASQRPEMQAAQNVAQVFLGLNLKCASCHDSFVSDWKLDDAYSFANIFADTVMEINRCDKPTGKYAGRRILYSELGKIEAEASTAERLRQLANFLTLPKDGRLSRTFVNRIWAKIMGRGIVEPLDEMDNVPWSQDLLDWLAYDFAENGYDIKRLLYTILTSRIYQMPTVSVKEEADLMAENFKFKGMIRRRLSAEQFADAVSEAFVPIYADSSMPNIKDKFPLKVKKQMPFVRASMVKNDGFLTSLGRPNRETVSTSRATQANLLQALEVTNGNRFTKTLVRGSGDWVQKYPHADSLVNQLYLNALGRTPVPKELSMAKKIVGDKPSPQGVQDLVWAVMLVPEFQLIF